MIPVPCFFSILSLVSLSLWIMLSLCSKHIIIIYTNVPKQNKVADGLLNSVYTIYLMLLQAPSHDDVSFIFPHFSNAQVSLIM